MNVRTPRFLPKFNAQLYFLRPRTGAARSNSTSNFVFGTQTGSLPRYRYSPLPSEENIRLLFLEPGPDDSPLKGTLRVVNLSDKPNYIALSYVWGHPAQDWEIVLGGEVFRITKSLSTALRDLRAMAGFRSVGIAYWIDQICINQADIAERNKQVQRMDRIYGCATGVITYIGPGDEETYQGIALAEKLNDTIESSGPMNNHFPDSKYRTFEYWEKLGFPPAGHSSWLALGKLMSRPWSNRAWIVQESMLNTIDKTGMVCGQRLVRWNTFSRIAFFELNGRIPDIPLADGVSKASLIIQADLRGFLYDRDYPHPQTFYHLLRITHILRSEDPKDKVYALLGLAKDRSALGIQPDYQQDPVRLYTDVAVWMIEVYKNLDILSSVFPDKIFCLPTWVPDWSTRERAMETLINNPILLRRNLRDASGGRSAEFHFSQNFTRLHVRGTTLDRVEFVQQTDSPPPLGGTFAFMMNRQGNKRLEKLWSTLQFLINHLDRLASLPMYSGRRESLVSWRNLLWRVAWSPWKRPDEEMEPSLGLWLKLNSLLGPLDEEDRASEAIAMTLFAAFEHTEKGRRFFITERGYVGLGPELTKCSDNVVIFLGGKFPYVIRRSGEGSEFLGEAYVHSVMNGEALKEPGCALQTFTLV